MPVVFTHMYLALNFYFLCRNFKATSKIMRKKNFSGKSRGTCNCEKPLLSLVPITTRFYCYQG